MRKYTSELYKDIAWRKTAGGRLYTKLFNKPGFLGWLYTKTAHAPIYNCLSKEKDFFKGVNKETLILDIGGNVGTYFQDKKTGKRVKSAKYYTLDIDFYSKPRVQANILKLPIKDNCVDIIVCHAVLEHISEPWKAIDEMHRILKKNGFMYFVVPFINRIHGAPHDYFRFTYDGVKHLLKEFNKRIILVDGGYFSSLGILIFLPTHWLDAFLGLGFLLRILMWPIMWLLVQLDRFDKYHLAATSYYGIAVK